MNTDKNKETHPSYGMVSFSRASGAGHLFGSPLSQHFGTIRLRINHGYREHDGEDKYRSDNQIVEVELSAAQFAEAITCMNMSEGVPCTLRWLGGRVDDVPHTEGNEMRRAQEQFKKTVSTFVSSIRKHGETIAEIMKKDKPSKDDRSKVNELVKRVVMEIDHNAPFWIELFQESTGKIASKAKAEVAAMFEHAIRAAGMEHIALQRGETTSMPELVAHEIHGDDQ